MDAKDQAGKSQTVSVRAKAGGAGACFLRALLVFFLALAAAPAGLAQDAWVDAAATRMAEAISHSKQRNVVVFDFVGPDQRVTTLGQKFGDQLTLALAKTGGGFAVKNRALIQETISENRFAPEIVRDSDVAPWLALQLGGDALILGTLSRQGEMLQVMVEGFRARDGESIGDFHTTLPITDEMKGLLDPSERENQRANTAVPAKNGYSYPRCLYCPAAAYSARGTKDKVQGTVILSTVVDDYGQVGDIMVQKGLPGLTVNALLAVQSWRLKPATDSDGNPAAVRQIINVTFQWRH
jgi:TonB family protein